MDLSCGKPHAESCFMPENNSEGENSKSSRRIRDTAREEALAAQFAADRERFKMTEEEKDEVFRGVRRLFVIEGKMTQEECDEIERQIAAEKIQKENDGGNGKEAGE